MPKVPLQYIPIIKEEYEFFDDEKAKRIQKKGSEELRKIQKEVDKQTNRDKKNS